MHYSTIKNFIVTFLITASVGGLFFATSVSAQTNTNARNIITDGLNTTAGQAGIDQREGTVDSVAASIGTMVNYLFGLLGVVFLTVVLVGGYIWLTAGGNDENIAKAKKWINNGILGMLVIFLAYALVYVILFALNRSVTG